jgi:hypothetical protein
MNQAVSTPASAWSWIVTHRYTLGLAALVTASLAFRLYVSQACSLWQDEASTAQDAYQPWPLLLRGPEREHPPLMFWMVRFATEILGRGDTGVRAVSLFFGCVLLVAVYRLCLELELSAPQGLAAAASLSLTPFFMKHAIEARQYAITGALVTFSTVFALRLLRGPFRLRTFVGFAVCSVAASAVQFFAYAYALALWAAVVVGTARRWRARTLPPRERIALVSILTLTLLSFGAISVLVVSLAHWYQTHALGGKAQHHFSVPSMWRAFSFLARPPWPSLEPFVAAFGLLFVAGRSRRLAGLIPFALTFAPIAVASKLSSGHSLGPRYLYPSFVFYQLGEVAAVFGVFELLAKLAGRWGRPVAALGLVALVVPLALRVREYPTGFGAGTAYYRGLQAYFEGPRGRDTALVVFVGYAGLRIMQTQYPVPHLMSLEAFEPIPGIERYVIAEFHSGDPNSSAKFEPLLKRHFGLSLRQWRALRPVRLPATRYQGPVRARLVLLDANAPSRTEQARTGQPGADGTPNAQGDQGATRDDAADGDAN